MDDNPVWVNDTHYYIIKAGQFGYGWDLYQKGGKLVGMSMASHRTRDQALDAVRETARAALRGGEG